MPLAESYWLNSNGNLNLTAFSWRALWLFWVVSREWLRGGNFAYIGKELRCSIDVKMHSSTTSNGLVLPLESSGSTGGSLVAHRPFSRRDVSLLSLASDEDDEVQFDSKQRSLSGPTAVACSDVSSLSSWVSFVTQYVESKNVILRLWTWSLRVRKPVAFEITVCVKTCAPATAAHQALKARFICLLVKRHHS